jgi:hypothetical protein
MNTICCLIALTEIHQYGVDWQGFQFRPANGGFRQTFSFNPTQIRQSFYV